MATGLNVDIGGDTAEAVKPGSMGCKRTLAPSVDSFALSAVPRIEGKEGWAAPNSMGEQ
jgi:hypothetical protein